MPRSLRRVAWLLTNSYSCLLYTSTYGSHTGIRLLAKAIDQPHLTEAEDEVRVLLRSYRHLGPGQADNFSLFASETIVSLWERLTATIAGMAVGIVSVFMIVGLSLIHISTGRGGAFQAFRT